MGSPFCCITKVVISRSPDISCLSHSHSFCWLGSDKRPLMMWRLTWVWLKMGKLLVLLVLDGVGLCFYLPEGRFYRFGHHFLSHSHFMSSGTLVTFLAWTILVVNKSQAGLAPATRSGDALSRPGGRNSGTQTVMECPCYWLWLRGPAPDAPILASMGFWRWQDACHFPYTGCGSLHGRCRDLCHCQRKCGTSRGC